MNWGKFRKKRDLLTEFRVLKEELIKEELIVQNALIDEQSIQQQINRLSNYFEKLLELVQASVSQGDSSNKLEKEVSAHFKEIYDILTKIEKFLDAQLNHLKNAWKLSDSAFSDLEYYLYEALKELNKNPNQGGGLTRHHFEAVFMSMDNDPNTLLFRDEKLLQGRAIFRSIFEIKEELSKVYMLAKRSSRINALAHKIWSINFSRNSIQPGDIQSIIAELNILKRKEVILEEESEEIEKNIRAYFAKGDPGNTSMDRAQSRNQIGLIHNSIMEIIRDIYPKVLADLLIESSWDRILQMDEDHRRELFLQVDREVERLLFETLKQKSYWNILMEDIKMQVREYWDNNAKTIIAKAVEAAQTYKRDLFARKNSSEVKAFLEKALK
ncbi:MAG: hypothetical protein ABIJ34_05375 [archaeon]